MKIDLRWYAFALLLSMCGAASKDDAPIRHNSVNTNRVSISAQRQFVPPPDAVAGSLLQRIRLTSSVELRQQLANHYEVNGYKTAAAIFAGGAALAQHHDWNPASPEPTDRWSCPDYEIPEAITLSHGASSEIDRGDYDGALKILSAAARRYPQSCFIQLAIAEVTLRKAEVNPPNVSAIDQEHAFRVLATAAGETEILPPRDTSHAGVFVVIAQYLSTLNDKHSERAAYLLAKQQAELRKEEILGGTEAQINKHLR
jgi:hypothetical protein